MASGSMMADSCGRLRRGGSILWQPPFRSGLASRLGTFFLAGTLHIQMCSASPRLDTGILPYADRREIQITAHVTQEGASFRPRMRRE
jgi:hypothetical protein